MRLWLTCLFALGLAGCEGPASDEPLPLSELGLELELGRAESADSLGVFQRVQDAVFQGSDIVVLDAAPPFVRVFDGHGTLKRALVRRGQGPGEAQRPIALEGAAAGALLITERSAVHEIDSAGQLLRSFKPQQTQIRGAARACNGDIVLLGSAQPRGPSALLRFRADGTTHDTIAMLGQPRPNSRLTHPAYFHADDQRILFYTEELDAARLLEVSCAGASRAVAIDSVGPPERLEVVSGGFNLHPSQPPIPAGLAVAGGHVLWATQPTAADDTTQAPTTLISVVQGGETRSIRIQGLYKLLDADERGRLLVSSSEPVPHVAVISGERLRDVIARRGTRRP